MPPSRPNVHAPPPLSPVVNNHQSSRSVAPGMPPNMFSVNSVPGHRGSIEDTCNDVRGAGSELNLCFRLQVAAQAAITEAIC